MIFKYRIEIIRSGGDSRHSIDDQLNRLGADGWQFVAWVDTAWSLSNGSGPDSRSAIFIKAIDPARYQGL